MSKGPNKCCNCKHFSVILGKCDIRYRSEQFGVTITKFELVERKMVEDTGYEYGSMDGDKAQKNAEIMYSAPQQILNNDGHCLYYKPRLYIWLIDRLYDLIYGKKDEYRNL